MDNTAQVQKPSSENSAIPDQKTFFQFFFPSVSTEKKDAFLRSLLEKDHNLSAQFYNFVSGEKPAKSKHDIDEIRSEVFEKLSDLDFGEIDFECYNHVRHGYIEEWEIYHEAAREEIKEVFQDYENEILKNIKKGNIVDATRILLGLYEGYQPVTEPAGDEYSVFDGADFNEELSSCFKEILKKAINIMENVVKVDENIKEIFTLLNERYLKYHQNNDLDSAISADEDFDNEEIEEENAFNEINYNFKIFEKFIFSLLVNNDVAKYLKGLFDKNQILVEDSAFIRLKISEILEDKNLWLKEAEFFWEKEPKIALRLLDEYLLSKNLVSFMTISKTAFEKWPDKFDQYITEKTDLDWQPGLYLNALSHFAKRSENIELFKKMKNLSTPEYIEKFIQGTVNDEIFYIQLLEVEKRYKEILNLVKKRNDSWNFIKLIQPILNIFPDECYTIYKEKIVKTLDNERGRSVYSRIAQWFVEMQKISTHQEKTKAFISETLKQNSKLRALKDEIQRVGLITF